jgi:ribosomal protection tetracycline resistance protein
MGPRLQWHFAKPTLEAVVVVRRGERLALHDALVQLVEQDPLIALRHDDLGQDLQVSLYGEVQKEVIAATLASEYGLVAEFHETTPICVERPVQSGEAFETIPSGRSRERPFLAGVGLRIDPAPIGSGFSYDDQSQLGYLPAAFRTAISETVAQTMRQGLFGWEVTDCSVTLTYSRYWPRQSHAHQGFSKAMSSIGSDFRLLTPLVVMDALRRAGVSVCEPWQHYELEVPADVLNVVLPVLARLGAAPTAQRAESSVVTLTGHVRAAMVHSLQRQIPSLTRGEGVLECAFDSYEKARQPWPTRRRADNNPLDRRDYLMKVRGAV